MSAYTAAMLGTIAVTFYFGYLSVNLNEKHDALKLFLILASFVMVWATLNLGNQVIATTMPSAALTNASNYIYSIGIWIGGLVLVYFILYFLFGVFRKSVDEREGRGGELT